MTASHTDLTPAQRLLPPDLTLSLRLTELEDGRVLVRAWRRSKGSMSPFGSWVMARGAINFETMTDCIGKFHQQLWTELDGIQLRFDLEEPPASPQAP